jgi:hypothetical protein
VIKGDREPMATLMSRKRFTHIDPIVVITIVLVALAVIAVALTVLGAPASTTG